MERLPKARNPLLLLAGLTGIIVLSAYINIVPPDSPLVLIGFFVLVAFSIGSLCSYLFKNIRHAMLIAGGVSVYLVLQLLGLRHPIYAVLLIASVIAVEYLWKENK